MVTAASGLHHGQCTMSNAQKEPPAKLQWRCLCDLNFLMTTAICFVGHGGGQSLYRPFLSLSSVFSKASDYGFSSLGHP
jgi:hypothetical protein